jgi:hypothetical protein
MIAAAVTPTVKSRPSLKTASSRPDYEVWDLTRTTPLLTAKAADQSGKKWDREDGTGLRFDKGVKNVEYFRDVKPILDRSCIACHTQKFARPAGNLALDDDKIVSLPNADDVPGTYYRLALDYAGRFGHKPLVGGWRNHNASATSGCFSRAQSSHLEGLRQANRRLEQ